MANKTGLTVLQVNKWFYNARRRDVKSLVDKSKHAKAVRIVLKEWLHKHLTNPYPSDGEKLNLATKTGLTVHQVHNWFKNARRREFKSLIDKSKQASEPKNELVDEQFENEAKEVRKQINLFLVNQKKNLYIDEQFDNAGNGNTANDDIYCSKKKSKKPLKEWLHKHLTSPYPSDAEKLHLANKTGLTVLQVHSWFINARRRKFKSLIDESKQASELKNELLDEQFESEAKRSTKTNKPFSCHLCQMRFLNRLNLKNHMLSVHEGKNPYNCSYCNCGFSRKDNLKKHIVSFHEDKKSQKSQKENEIVSVEKDFSEFGEVKNELIDEKFESEELENIPKGSRKINKHFSCYLCKGRFLNQLNLKNHMLSVHEGKNPFNCSYCGDTFKKSKGLLNHLKEVHEGEKPYNCSHCNSAFSRKLKIKRHIESVHEGNRPFVCAICSHDFARNNELKRHILVHEEKKPYECAKCESSFTQSGHLRKHVREVHERMEEKESKKRITVNNLVSEDPLNM